jgi:squalene synthase HpnC
MAIYNFARTADNLADEGEAPPHQRLADLGRYRSCLDDMLAGRPADQRWVGVFEALALQVQRFALPSQPLHDLLDAFEQDVRNPGYGDRAALLDYCRLSANPIGRLLLHLNGVSEPTALRQSDSICSALQLINFWQDLSIDGPRGRHYVPGMDRERYGVSEQELHRCEDSQRSRELVRDLADWSQGLMLAGAPLAFRLPGRVGWELRFVVQGGLRILEKIRRMNHSVLRQRPTINTLDGPQMLWRAICMGRAHP